MPTRLRHPASLLLLVLRFSCFFFFFSFFFSSFEEIIGFPFIVLELTQEVASTNVRVFDQQMIYVKPEWNRPPYEVTTLQFAPNLLQGIRKFDAYVYAQFTQKNKSFCFVTDGPNDLMYVLRRESKLKGVRLAAYFDRFYDLGKEFEKFYPE
jgi:hypothetical protein